MCFRRSRIINFRHFVKELLNSSYLSERINYLTVNLLRKHLFLGLWITIQNYQCDQNTKNKIMKIPFYLIQYIEQFNANDLKRDKTLFSYSSGKNITNRYLVLFYWFRFMQQTCT